MIIIRLKRVGKKKNPQYSIVLIAKNRAQNGKHIEKLGYFDVKKNNKKINFKRIQHWLNVGAQLSKRVNILLKNYKSEAVNEN